MTSTTGGSPERARAGRPKRRIRRRLELEAMRHRVLRSALGIYLVYQSVGGGLIASGLAYAALFALIPSLALVAAGLAVVVDDPTVRADAVELLMSSFPALEGVVAPAIEDAVEHVALGSVIALIGFGWAASGLYLNLTRAMERLFPGERVSGVLARLGGILVVFLVMLGVLAAVLAGSLLSGIAAALAVDAEWLLAVVGAVLTVVVASGVTYGIYRVLPAAPPAPRSSRPPALLVGAFIGLLTLGYGLLSPWLTSGFAVFGVIANVFVALVWLRLVFIAITYGAAAARFTDAVGSARRTGTAAPDVAITTRLLDEEAERVRRSESDRTDPVVTNHEPPP